MKQKAIVFIEFEHKLDTIESARSEGFAVVLMTQKNISKLGVFDEVFECDFTDRDEIDRVTTSIQKNNRVRAIISNYEAYVVMRSYIAEKLRVPCTSLYGACATRNKVLQRHSLSFMRENIPFTMVHTFAAAKRSFKRFGEDVYIKSIAGVKSQLVFHVTTEEKLIEAVEAIKKSSLTMSKKLNDDFSYLDFHFDYPDPAKYFLVEKAVYGKQVTVLTLVGNHTLWHGPSVADVYTAKDIGRDDSFLAFRVLPSRQSKEIILKAKKVTETAIGMLSSRYCGIHAELIITADGSVKIIEIASRLGGYRSLMYQKAYEINIAKRMILSAIGKEVKTRRQRKAFVSMVTIYAECSGSFVEVKNISDIQNNSDISDIKLRPQVGGLVGKASHGYDPVLSFCITGKTYKDVYDQSVFFHKHLVVETQL